MTKLVYFPCKCIKRGDAILPGSRGHLAAVTNGVMHQVASCARCKDANPVLDDTRNVTYMGV